MSDTPMTHLSLCNMKLSNECKNIGGFSTALKILGFVYNGRAGSIPAQGTNNDFIGENQISPNLSSCLKKSQKECVDATSDTPVTQGRGRR